METELGVVKTPAGQVMSVGRINTGYKDVMHKRQYSSDRHMDNVVTSFSCSKPVIHGKQKCFKDLHVHNPMSGKVNSVTSESQEMVVKHDINSNINVDKDSMLCNDNSALETHHGIKESDASNAHEQDVADAPVSRNDVLVNSSICNILQGQGISDKQVKRGNRCDQHDNVNKTFD